MNILIDTLPKTVDIGGRKYHINTDFRAGIKFEELELNTESDIYNLLTLYFGDAFPADIRGALEAVRWFYACGEIPDKKDEPKDKTPKYSFKVDNGVILADFWQFYNIDLTQEGLHWWVFRALLFGLPQESEFKQRIYYRGLTASDMKGFTQKEKKRIAKIKDAIKIEVKEKDKITLEQRNAQMIAYIQKRQTETKGGGVNG